jgi:hypothetical protein
MVLSYMIPRPSGERSRQGHWQVPGNVPAPVQLVPLQQSAPVSQEPPGTEQAQAPAVQVSLRQSLPRVQHTPVGATQRL